MYINIQIYYIFQYLPYVYVSLAKRLQLFVVGRDETRSFFGVRQEKQNRGSLSGVAR